LQDVDYQLRSLWGIFVSVFNEGNYPEALKWAEQFRTVARRSSNPHDMKAGDRLLGFALHLLGDQDQARYYIEGMLKSYVVPTRRSDFVRFQYDQRVAARVPLSSILWLQGFADQAMDNVTRAIEEAQSINHAISLGYALSTAACPTAFFVGDLAAAERFVAMLADHSAAYGLGPWSVWGRYFGSVLQARRGALQAGLHGIATALNELRTTGFVLRYSFYLAEYAELLGKAGRPDEGLAAMEEALSRCQRDEEGSCFAELLRVKGELLLRQGRPGAGEAAQTLFQASLHDAARHSTPAWTLRTATSLARLRITQNRAAEAQALLADSYASFSEGFDSFDLVQAREILRVLVRQTEV
jgi:tetratricopeptide (TPR) repeat protein